jgi:cytochrome c556
MYVGTCASYDVKHIHAICVKVVMMKVCVSTFCHKNSSKRVIKMQKMMKEVVAQDLTELTKMLKQCGI